MTGALPHFPDYRPRRLRRLPALRRLVQETTLEPRHLIAPLFVVQAARRREEIPSMPGIFRLGLTEAVQEARTLHRLGVGGALLFGIPRAKDSKGTQAYSASGVVQQAVRAIKKAVPELVVITDVCLCEYTDHGHCGVLNPSFRGPLACARDRLRPRNPTRSVVSSEARDPFLFQNEISRRFAARDDMIVDNDATLPLLARTAVSHARAGADLVAPSAMMDGQVGAIRRALDEAGLADTGILSYSAKYASALYGPFREAAQSAPRQGDRRGYQMDPANREEALREAALDIQEGADIVMVKPALPCLDVVRAVKEKFRWPVAAYQVSGEYALVKAAAARGWVEEKRLVLELATAVRRAGADLVISYHAKELASWLEEQASLRAPTVLIRFDESKRISGGEAISRDDG